MKTLTILAFLIPVGFAHAEPVCPKFFICGTYKMSQLNDDKSETVTSLTISGLGPLAAEYDYVIATGGKEEAAWRLKVEFKDDGAFVMTNRDGSTFAAGVCLDQVCTYGMRPFTKPATGSPVSGNAGIFNFDGDKFNLDMFYGLPGRLGESRQVLSK